MRWARVSVLALFSTILVILLASTTIEAQGSSQFYPCVTCHQALNLTGNRKIVPFHGIDLTKGAHRGLVCSSCHVPPTMQKLVNNAEVYIPGLHTTEDLKKTNSVCAVCHPRQYLDYNYLVHGNKTFICPDGNVTKVIGYKGVGYDFHICPEYKNLTTVPAKACVECHNPHDPTMPPPSILPEPSIRPPPPNEAGIAFGGLAAIIGGLLLVAGALFLPLSRDER